MKANTFTREDLARFVKAGQMSPVAAVPEGAGSDMSERGRANELPAPHQGSGAGITDPSIPKSGVGASETGGLDYLKLRVAGKWKDRETYDVVMRVLERAQEDARSGGSGLFTIADGLHGQMVSAGTGGGATYCGYVFWVDGSRFAVSGREPESQVHSDTIGWYEGASTPCMSAGQAGLRNLRDFVFGKLGIVVESEHVSRTDACVDITGVNASKIIELVTKRQYVSKGRKGRLEWDGRELTGVYVGRGDVMIRIYDKLAESSDNEDKVELMKSARWGGKLPDDAIRVEFQLKREALVALGIDTFKDLQGGMANLVEYLTMGWFRMVTGEVDPKHPDRSPTSEFWQDVQNRFKSWAKGNWVKVHRKHKPKPAIRKLVDQFRGCLTSIVARLSDVNSEEERRAVLDYVFCNVGTGDAFVADVKAKRTEFAARGKTTMDIVDLEADYAMLEREAIQFHERIAEAELAPQLFEPEHRNEHDLPAWVETWE